MQTSPELIESILVAIIAIVAFIGGGAWIYWHTFKREER